MIDDDRREKALNEESTKIKNLNYQHVRTPHRSIYKSFSEANPSNINEEKNWVDYVNLSHSEPCIYK